MTDKTVKSLYWTLYLENRILKNESKINNEKTSEVYVIGRESRCLGRFPFGKRHQEENFQG